MRNGRSVAAAGALWALSAGLVFASDETAHRTPVYLASTAQDIYGKQFVYHVRELLRGSKGLALAQSEDEAVYQVRIVAIDDESNGIAYSVVWTERSINKGGLPVYITHSVGTCGRNVLESCARTVIASTDEQVQNDADFWAEALKQLELSKHKAPTQ